jgi:hypothetical protein
VVCLLIPRGEVALSTAFSGRSGFCASAGHCRLRRRAGPVVGINVANANGDPKCEHPRVVRV